MALAQIHYTHTGAAFVLWVSRETFEQFLRRHRSARKAWDRGRAIERVSLRPQQFMQAETNPAMAIWLGKIYLGQRDPGRCQRRFNLADAVADGGGERSSPNGKPQKL